MPGPLASCTDDDLVARLLLARAEQQRHARCGGCRDGRAANLDVDAVLDEMLWRQTARPTPAAT